MSLASNDFGDLNLLTYKHLTQKLGVDRKTIYRMIDSGRLPRPIRITARTVRFDAEQVLRYLRKFQG